MDHISILITISCILSICGSLLIIVMYNRLAYRNNLALSLICHMSISDLVCSVSNLLYVQPGEGDDPSDIRCIIQGVLLQFSELSCFIFCFELMVCIYLSVIQNNQKMHLYKNKCLAIGYMVPAVISLIPLAGHYYGSIGYSCGYYYNDVRTNLMANFEAILFFDIPLWTFNLGNIYLIFCVIKFMRGFQGSCQDKEIRLSQSILKNMLWYPVIMIFCWGGFTVHKIFKMVGTDLQWLKGPRFILTDLIGFFNSIAYVINHLLFKKLQNLVYNEQQIIINDDEQDSQDSRKMNLSIRSFMSTSSSGYDTKDLDDIDF